MKVKTWMSEMQKIIKENPEVLEWGMIYSKDDEGNGYEKVHFDPSTCLYDYEDREVIAYEDEDGEIETPKEKHNVVIIN